MAFDRSTIHVYAGAESRGLFRKALEEARWASLTHGLPQPTEVQAIAVHPQQPEMVFAGTQHLWPTRLGSGPSLWWGRAERVPVAPLEVMHACR
jgi:hypothetical protein